VKRFLFPPRLLADVDKFILGRVKIPDSVANKQLDVKIQLERNDMQDNMKKAQLERDMTDVNVNKINLEATKTLRIAQANANLVRKQATADAKAIVEKATFDGLANLYTECGITSAKHKASLDYLRTLESRAVNSDTLSKDNVGVVYLSDNNVLKTTT
jgi:hypothetical protein